MKLFSVICSLLLLAGCNADQSSHAVASIVDPVVSEALAADGCSGGKTKKALSGYPVGAPYSPLNCKLSECRNVGNGYSKSHVDLNNFQVTIDFAYSAVAGTAPSNACPSGGTYTGS